MNVHVCTFTFIRIYKRILRSTDTNTHLDDDSVFHLAKSMKRRSVGSWPHQKFKKRNFEFFERLCINVFLFYFTCVPDGYVDISTSRVRAMQTVQLDIVPW